MRPSRPHFAGTFDDGHSGYAPEISLRHGYCAASRCLSVATACSCAANLSLEGKRSLTLLLAANKRLAPYEKFAEMIDRHWDGIAAYCKPENKVSLGFVEGLNNKIRVIQRRAYAAHKQDSCIFAKRLSPFLSSPICLVD
jgi:hypothetical protein